MTPDHVGCEPLCDTGKASDLWKVSAEITGLPDKLEDDDRGMTDARKERVAAFAHSGHP